MPLVQSLKQLELYVKVVILVLYELTSKGRILNMSVKSVADGHVLKVAEILKRDANDFFWKKEIAFFENAM